MALSLWRAHLLRRQAPGAEVASFRFKAVRPTFDLHPFRVNGAPSADGKTVTIRLRPNVKFHDGEPLTAEAAKYSLDRHLTMKGSYRRPEIGVIDSVSISRLRPVLPQTFSTS